jgi:hypothetical protein
MATGALFAARRILILPMKIHIHLTVSGVPVTVRRTDVEPVRKMKVLPVFLM